MSRETLPSFLVCLGVMAICLVVVCLVALGGPTPVQAGLVGPNPVVSITVGEFSVDNPWHSNLTVTNDGIIIYETGDGTIVKTRRRGRVDPKIFVNLASALAPYREQSGFPVRKSKNCLTDIVMPNITWVYENGKSLEKSVGNNCRAGHDPDIGRALFATQEQAEKNALENIAIPKTTRRQWE